MSSAAVLDIDSLLQPISEEKPVGEDLREDSSPSSVYYQIKDSRSQARAEERQALMAGEDETKAADWRPLLQLVPKTLSERTKDLEITAYLMEALVREHGFPGLRDGCKLVQGLVEKFGDDIFPLPDEDGLETRVAPLTGLNGDDAEGTLVRPIYNVPITGMTSIGDFNTGDYRISLETSRMPPEAQATRVAQGAATLETLQAAAGETNPDFYRTTYHDLMDAKSAFADMTAALDAKYGYDSPPSSNIRNALDECLEALKALARDIIAAEEAADAAPDDAAAEEDAAAGGAGDGAANQPKGEHIGELNSRDEAFNAIMKISAYFRRTEPHSPISYALEQIVRWGRMPLPELLKELISDENSVHQLFKLTGIPENRQDDQM